jgi:hypothetical protein
MEKLLKPAASSAMMLMAAVWAMMADGMSFAHLAFAGTMFVGSGIWLAAQGELRAELKAVGKRQERRQRMEKIDQVQRSLEVDSQPVQPLLSLLSPEPIALSAGEATPSSTSSALMTAKPESQPLSSNITATLSESKRTYHFDSEESAAAAAVGEISIEQMSQAKSVGAIKTVAPELYMQAERMHKRSKRRGALTQEEMLYGDIHHKPIIVLAFIASIILFGIYTVWNFGSASAGILVISGAISLILIGISRWRASSNDLTLPDVLGIETPFAATIAGLTLMHITSRLAAGATMGNQLDFAVFAVIILLIIGISLTGRKDLVHRIPAAIEWYVATLLVTRIAGAMMAGTMPMPVLTDPFTIPSGGDMLSYTVPWLLVEAVLLVCVIGWDWIEAVRRRHNLPDFHGAAGRGGWVVTVSMLSIGPVALLAIFLGLRRSFQWQQPAAVGIIVLSTVVVARSFASWYDGLVEYIPHLMIVLGIISLTCLAASVPMRKPAWSTAWSWDAHLLLPLGVLFLTGISPLMVVTLLALSLTIWVTGILQLRRSLRVWGAADLVFALTAAALTSQGLLNSTSLLLMGIALGLELGIIAWLGQKHEGQMALD